MSVKIYKDGAWQEVANLRRNADGAWTDCQAAYKYENGAWISVWENIKMFDLFSLPTNKGQQGSVYSNKRGMIFTQVPANGALTGPMPNNGYIDLQIDGTWSKPTISFDWSGGLLYWNNNYTKGYRIPAGTITAYAYYTKPDGSTNYNIFGSGIVVGSSASWNNAVEIETGSVLRSMTEERAYDRIRITIVPVNTTISYFDASKEIVIDNLFIDGKQIGFPDKLNFIND